MKGLEREMERQRQLVVALVGREELGCAYGSGGGVVGGAVMVMRNILGKAHLSLG